MQQSFLAVNSVGIVCLGAVAIGTWQIQRGKTTSGLFLVSLGMLGLFGMHRVAR